jgi:hypothetical protein
MVPVAVFVVLVAVVIMPAVGVIVIVVMGAATRLVMIVVVRVRTGWLVVGVVAGRRGHERIIGGPGGGRGGTSGRTPRTVGGRRYGPRRCPRLGGRDSDDEDVHAGNA